MPLCLSALSVIRTGDSKCILPTLVFHCIWGGDIGSCEETKGKADDNGCRLSTVPGSDLVHDEVVGITVEDAPASCGEGPELIVIKDGPGICGKFCTEGDPVEAERVI